MIVTAFDIAERFIGISEVPGSHSNPQVLAMLRLDAKWPEGDEVPWCSAFVNYVAWLMRLPRSKSLRARSWLQVGRPVEWADPEGPGPEVGYDVVILSRGEGKQPGPEVIDAPGHVGFFAGWADGIHVLGGNQANQVSVRRFMRADVLGVRRLYEVT